MRNSVLVFALVSLPLVGCISAKSSLGGAVATGAPLAVVDDVKVWTTQQEEKVGTAVHRDAAGNAVGSSDVYETTTQVHSKPIWYAVQGTAQISDEDFFRIAGDDASLQATISLRSRARRKVRIGQVTLVTGAIAAVAAYFVPSTKAKIGLGVGGLVAATAGWYIGHSGAEQLEPDHHAVERSIAERDAAEYNQSLGARSALTVGVSGEF